jgi:hypothetical protein
MLEGRTTRRRSSVMLWWQLSGLQAIRLANWLDDLELIRKRFGKLVHARLGGMLRADKERAEGWCVIPRPHCHQLGGRFHWFHCSSLIFGPA